MRAGIVSFVIAALPVLLDRLVAEVCEVFFFSSFFANATTIFKTLHSIYFNLREYFFGEFLNMFSQVKGVWEYSGGKFVEKKVKYKDLLF